jgi:zinc/manganese transport system substrate-binding protein
MNGTGPSPQDTALEKGRFAGHRVKVFVYNQQVVDALTTSLKDAAVAAGVPVAGDYETMPIPGYDDQSRMLAEVTDLAKAVASKISTQRL